MDQIIITQYQVESKVYLLANLTTLLLFETAGLESQSFLCWKLLNIP